MLDVIEKAVGVLIPIKTGWTLLERQGSSGQVGLDPNKDKLDIAEKLRF